MFSSRSPWVSFSMLASTVTTAGSYWVELQELTFNMHGWNTPLMTNWHSTGFWTRLEGSWVPRCNHPRRRNAKRYSPDKSRHDSSGSDSPSRYKYWIPWRHNTHKKSYAKSHVKFPWYLFFLRMMLHTFNLLSELDDRGCLRCLPHCTYRKWLDLSLS